MTRRLIPTVESMALACGKVGRTITNNLDLPVWIYWTIALMPPCNHYHHHQMLRMVLLLQVPTHSSSWEGKVAMQYLAPNGIVILNNSAKPIKPLAENINGVSE